MDRKRWYIWLGVALVASSAVTYLAQLLIFRSTRDTFFYMLQDLAFVPVQVLLVMVFLDRLLQKKDKEALLNKLNMMIGVFFNEVGTELMCIFCEMEQSVEALRGRMTTIGSWEDHDFDDAQVFLKRYNYQILAQPEILLRLRGYLLARRGEMLRMLENPNLLEHDAFTDLLWAVFHLTDELQHRQELTDLPKTDVDHLRGDAVRACRLLFLAWLDYMLHLKRNYPYLYSLAVRINPFDSKASPTVY